MPKVRETILTSVKTGEVHTFESIVTAEEFLGKGNGYIKRMVANGKWVFDEKDRPYEARFGQIKTIQVERDCNYDDKAQLCWRCKKAVGGGCNWSRSFEPVDGWTAVETKIITQSRLNSIPSYRISKCPEFVFG